MKKTLREWIFYQKQNNIKYLKVVNPYTGRFVVIVGGTMHLPKCNSNTINLNQKYEFVDKEKNGDNNYNE